ncbi:MAG: hypothetical protein AAGD25_06590 [Cyanobacteria bacterium P01_F01_bin.150]
MAINKGFGEGNSATKQSKTEPKSTSKASSEKVSASAFDIVNQGSQSAQMIEGLLQNNGAALNESVDRLADQREQEIGMNMAMRLHPDVQAARALGYAVNFLSNCDRSPVDLSRLGQSQALQPVQPLQLASLQHLYEARASHGKAQQIQGSSEQK